MKNKVNKVYWNLGKNNENLLKEKRMCVHKNWIELNEIKRNKN